MAKLSNYGLYSPIKAKFSGTATCGHTIILGDLIAFRPLDRKTLCNACKQLRDKEISLARAIQARREPDLFSSAMAKP